MAKLRRHWFCGIAVRRAFLSKDQTLEALRLQKSGAATGRIGEILIERGSLDPSQVAEILEFQRRLRERQEAGNRVEEPRVSQPEDLADDLDRPPNVIRRCMGAVSRNPMRVAAMLLLLATVATSCRTWDRA